MNNAFVKERKIFWNIVAYNAQYIGKPRRYASSMKIKLDGLNVRGFYFEINRGFNCTHAQKQEGK